jgi:hypothetical protein
MPRIDLSNIITPSRTNRLDAARFVCPCDRADADLLRDHGERLIQLAKRIKDLRAGVDPTLGGLRARITRLAPDEPSHEPQIGRGLVPAELAQRLLSVSSPNEKGFPEAVTRQIISPRAYMIRYARQYDRNDINDQSPCVAHLTDDGCRGGVPPFQRRQEWLQGRYV